MGTLFDQPPRGESLGKIMRGLHMQAADFGFPDPMTPADWHAFCDLVRTALVVQSADIFDEQLGGFGDILNRLVEALGEIKGTA
jgi:hypothetical protein